MAYSGHFHSDGHMIVGSNFHGPVNFTAPADACRRAFAVVDPRDERVKLLARKDRLMNNTCAWLRDDLAYRQWQNDPHTRLLWIHGDPGKGKTMMMMAQIAELEQGPRQTAATTAYFFCQSAVDGLNTTVGLLRGLVYALACAHRPLWDILEQVYREQGAQLFEGTSAMFALWRLLVEVLRQLSDRTVLILIDAVDECTHGQEELLQFLCGDDVVTLDHVKWLVTSRNEPPITRSLEGLAHGRHVSLEVNSERVSAAVNEYIRYQLSRLPTQNGYDARRKARVGQYLHERAADTFLWVALVCRELHQTLGHELESVLGSMPSGLTPLYQRMLAQLMQHRQPTTAAYCQQIVRTATLAYRPVSVRALGMLAELPEHVQTHTGDMMALINICGSFLTVREEIVYFIHQSAQDFLVEQGAGTFYRDSLRWEHRLMFWQALGRMSGWLHRDVCKVGQPGTQVDNVSEQHIGRHLPDHIQYLCRYWIDHWRSAIGTDLRIASVDDHVAAAQFLLSHLLYWIEAMSWMRQVSEAIQMLRRLAEVINLLSDAGEFVKDAQRVLLYHRPALEAAPLQAYVAAILFSPQESLVRQRFWGDRMAGLAVVGSVDERWSPCLQTLEGHSKGVTAVAFSPDRRLLASASDDKTVRLWDVETGRERRVLAGHSDAVRAVVFSLDGRLLASASRDKTVRLWDGETGRERGLLAGHSDRVSVVVFSPDGRLLTSASDDRTVRLWDVETGRERGVLAGHIFAVRAVVFSPDGRLLASATDDNMVRLWDVETGRAQGALKFGFDWVMTVAFSLDGRLLASALEDKTVRLCDVEKGAERGVLVGHSNWVRVVVFSPDGRLLASASDDKTVRLWDVETGREQGVLAGHPDAVRAVVFSLDGRLLASASDDETVRLWDVETGTERGVLVGHSKWVTTVAFSPDGQLLASASDDKTVRLWDVKTGAERGVLVGHSALVSGVAFSPDGRLLASVSEDETVRLWDVETGLEQGELVGSSNWMTTVAFSPDGRLLASASDDEMVRLWDGETGRERGLLAGHSDRVSVVVFSPDGRLLASASRDKTVRLWAVETGEERGVLVGHSNWVLTVAFSPDGRLLASASDDDTVRLWDVETGTERGVLAGHFDGVRVVAFTPDGRLLASVSNETVWLWDVETETERGVLAGHSDAVHAVHAAAFSREGRYLRTNSGALLPVQPGPGHDRLTASDSTLAIKGQWVFSNFKKVLWIPPDYRGDAVATHGQAIGIGNGTGRVIIVTDSLPQTSMHA